MLRTQWDRILVIPYVHFSKAKFRFHNTLRRKFDLESWKFCRILYIVIYKESNNLASRTNQKRGLAFRTCFELCVGRYILLVTSVTGKSAKGARGFQTLHGSVNLNSSANQITSFYYYQLFNMVTTMFRASKNRLLNPMKQSRP